MSSFYKTIMLLVSLMAYATISLADIPANPSDVGSKQNTAVPTTSSPITPGQGASADKAAEPVRDICNTYDDCLAKAEAIGLNANRSPDDEALAIELTRRAASLAEKDSAAYYYALARHYSWSKDTIFKKDELTTSSLEKAVALGKQDFDTVKWLWYRLHEDRCKDAAKLLDTVPIEKTERNLEELIEMYDQKECGNASKSVKAGMELVDVSIKNHRFDGRTRLNVSVYLGYDEDSKGFVFKDEIDAFINSKIKQYPSEYVFYEVRGHNKLRLGRFLRALEDINKALKLAPDTESTLSYHLRMRAHMGLKDYRKALQDANYVLSTEKDGGPLSTRTTRADIYVALGEYVNAKKDFVIACDSNVIGACDKLRGFERDEKRGRNWVYFSTNRNKKELYYDKTRLAKAKNTVSAWLRFESDSDSDDYELEYATINCRDNTLTLTQGKKDRTFHPIAPDSIYQSLRNTVCEGKRLREKAEKKRGKAYGT